ncbi:MAG: S41 family peptidase [Oscillospiraceae bacterium]|nr:S41 family peptidase [Oscillospiraceae bacterium]
MLLASALTCLVIALTFGRELGVFNGKFRYVREFSELLTLIDEFYIGEYDMAEVSAMSKWGAVAALRDRYSYYLTPEQYAEHLESANNRFAGIGISITIDDYAGGMLVLHVFRGSPAETAGIVSGDVITGFDGEDITHLMIDETRNIFARPIGSTVELTVLRETGVVETITVVYDFVFVDPVSYDMLYETIGYIALSNFDTGSADSFISAVDGLIESGAEAFIFDVRNNGGGRVSELTGILDHLLPAGEIFIAVDRHGNEDIIRSGPGVIDLPAVVLVNRYSFSAAEYFAAMLREYDYAHIVGEQTTGKSRSQILIPLSCGGAMRISSGQYLTKNRVSLYDVGGVTPDYLLEMSEDEFTLFRFGNLEKEDDTQLQLALSLLIGH